ncbi:hypothetical protein PR202_ga11284 [Eleusine coracana subsp. coracana]|uniref:AIG1-type G domain-containing protein n=1 Tax=Eleusine coracana subsp. coracana TaxID=191504 RepID=A0AAV5C955_ELECO|nr:hypothetical protein QOZ80_5AG0404670 [Eleusine coracana subsp. coracana]GJM94622.1 hypothetical protein PR202_ga11284 [Eleusine coracana subsp. coracana]
MATTTTTDSEPVAPLAEQEEEPKKVEPAAAAAAVEEEEEEPKKVEAGGDGEGKDEEVRLEGTGGEVGSPEAENGEAEADSGEVEAAEGDGRSGSLGAAEAEKEDRELAAEVAEVAASAVAETQAPGVESTNGELGEGDASPASPDAPAGEEKGEFEEGEKPEEAVVAAEVKDVGEVAADAEPAVPVEKEPEGTKIEEMGSGDGGGGELGGGKEEEEVAAPAGSVVGAEPEDKVAPATETNGKLVGEVEVMDVGGEEAPEESPEKEANIEDEAAKPETLNEESPEIMNDGTVEEIARASEEAIPEPASKASLASEDTQPEPATDASPASEDTQPEPATDASPASEATKPEPVTETSPAGEETKPGQETEASPVVMMNDGKLEDLAPESEDSVPEGITEKGLNDEGQGPASETVQDFGVDKPTEAESIVSADTGILSREMAPESIKENNGDEEAKAATVDVGRDEEAGDDDIVEAAADDIEGVGNEADEEDGTSPARVAIIESSEAAKQIMKELAEGSSSGSVSGSRDYTNSMDGQVMLDDSEEEEEDDDDDNDDGDEKGFDSAALAALLKAATGSSDGNISVASQDGSRIFTMDRPAGLGSSAPSLRPSAPRQPARSNLFSPSELAVTVDPTEEMTEEEKKLHDKVELIRVKFLRLVYRLGATPEETVAAQVLYRLSLAEGIRHGRQTNRAFSLDNARKKALLLETEGKEDLNFSCNILVLGKTGVGKSATINSIFGEEKSKTNAFTSATTNVREIVGDVDGVKIRIIDTPGLRPNVMDQGSNRKILAAVKKYTKRCPPDIVLYVDRLDSLSRDLNDLPLLKTITAVLGSSIWFNAIVALTHAASAPPEGLNGAPMTYEVLMAQRSHIIQQSIRQAAGDMRLMNPVALVENHPSCRRNREGQKVLPNGQSWRHQMLLLCYSSKILSEANALLKLQDPNPGKLFGFRFRSPPLPFLLSSLLQSRAHPKLSPDQGGNEGDSDIELDDYSDMEQDDDEEEYDQLPPFKPLTKAQLARLTKEQKNAYFDEYDYRVKLLQKKQWKDEIRRLKEMKKRGKTDLDDYGYANIAGDNDQDPPPENVSVPLPDMVLPPSFDCDNPTYRYRFLEPTSTVLARPVLDAHGWDHDCGYDGVSVEETLAILSRFPANVAVQVTKDKKEFSIHLDSSVSAKHGENASSLAGFDIQTVGRQLAYILRGETKIKNIKKNKTTGGFSVTFLGDIVATGLKVEDQLSLGKRLALVASTGAMRAQGDTAYGANLEARLKDKDYPIGQSLSTLGLSLMKWRRDLALGANLQSQFSIGRGSKMAVRLGLNNKLSGQITVRTSTSEQVQIALLGLVPIAASIYRSFRPSEPSFAY